jgi:hypothetical protein
MVYDEGRGDRATYLWMYGEDWTNRKNRSCASSPVETFDLAVKVRCTKQGCFRTE